MVTFSTIRCKYKYYFHSTVHTAEERLFIFAVCRLPFAIIVMLNLSNYCYFEFTYNSCHLGTTPR